MMYLIDAMRIIYQFLSINFLKILNKILGLSFFPVSSAVPCVAGGLQGLLVQDLLCPTLLRATALSPTL